MTEIHGGQEFARLPAVFGLCPLILSSWWIRRKGFVGQFVRPGPTNWFKRVDGSNTLPNRDVAEKCVICGVQFFNRFTQSQFKASAS